MTDHITAQPSEELAATAREFYRRGWVLGTSGNFSALVSAEPFRVRITASGNDKGALDASHFLEIDGDGSVLAGAGKPSAETALHLAIYRTAPNALSIMHTHSVWGTILSELYANDGAIEIEGYEMLKGLAGVTTHEHTEIIPVIENSQEYDALAREVEDLIDQAVGVHGIYLRRHGLYTWGKTIAEAKRHVEIFEFLFEVCGRLALSSR